MHALDDHSEAEHHGPESITRVVLIVFAALCLLTCASLLTYTRFWQQRVPIEVGRLVMMAVSVSKAYLVVTFFMHLWWEAKWKYVVTIPAMCVSTLLGLALIPDIGRRTLEYDNARLLNAAEALPFAVGHDIKVARPTPMGAPSESKQPAH